MATSKSIDAIEVILGYLDGRGELPEEVETAKANLTDYLHLFDDDKQN